MENFDYEIEVSGSYLRKEDEIEIDLIQPSEETKPENLDKGKQEFDPVAFSSKIMKALSNKVKDINKKSLGRLTTDQLRQVYRNGAEIFSSTDVWKNQFPEKDAGQWAMARVNMFLRMKSGDKRQGKKQRVSANKFLDISASWCPIDEDFAQAREDIKEYDLQEKFEDVNELYLDGYKKEMFNWEL